MTIIEFIEARLDEDEQIAEAAAEKDTADWYGNADSGVASASGGYIATGPYGGDLSEEAAVHMARHDPAQVLRQTKALRAVVADHRNDEGDCARCWDQDETVPAHRMHPCPTLQAIASIWSHHPGYRPDLGTP